MRKYWRNGSRVLSAILSAAMVFTSLPAGLTAYAEESAYAAVVTEDVGTAETAVTAETGEDAAPVEGSEAATEGEASSDAASADTTPAGESEGTSAGTTEETTEGTAEGSAEGATESSTEGTTEDAGEASSEGTTEAAAEAVTEAATEETTEETAEEETEEEVSAFDVFPGMGEDYTLSTQELADKAALAENLEEILPEAADAEDYEDADDVYTLGEVVYLADSEEEAQRVANAYGGTLKSYSYGVAVIGLGENATVSLALAAAADEDTLLPAVWPNYYYDLVDTGEAYYNDPALEDTDSNYQWQHDYIGDSYAWAAGYEGQGIKVAVIDSGLDESHEDLGNAQPGKNFANGAAGTAWSTDENGHGTHVAGIIAATADNGKGGAGIAPKASVTGFCTTIQMDNHDAREADLMRAINAAVEDGYHLINMSLAGFYYSDNMAATIRNAYNAGVGVFCASGNDAANTYAYPASYPGSISVAAVDQSGAKADFSNYGSTVDLAFPGVAIYSTIPTTNQYGKMSGTSMACPAAVGTAAVILSAREDILAKSGKARVDSLLSVMKKGAIKASGSGMGSGTTYLPNALGLATVETVPSTPTIEITGTLDDKGRNYMDETVTATISVTSRDSLAIYYSTDGKTPTYRNGAVTNGTLLTDTTVTKSLYTGTVELTGARKVTLKAIALNTMTGKVSKVATKAVSLTPIPTGVEITQANNITSIVAGKRVALKATVTPSYAISTKVQWSVDEEAAAQGIKVSNGTVTTKATTAAGYYTITATAVGSDGKTYDGESAEYVLEVQAASVQVRSFKLSDSKVTLTLPDDDTWMLEPVIVLQDESQDAPGVVWTSNKESVATVDDTGTVTAVGKGKATITAMLNDGSGKKATCAVTVNSYVTDITISGPATVAAGKSITLTAGITPADATNKKVTWSIVDGSDLVTLRNGRLTAKKGASGECTVQATAADGSGATSEEYTVTVVASPITAIQLVDDSQKVVKSMTLFRTAGHAQSATTGSLTAVVTGGTADADTLQFTSSAPNVVEVRQNEAGTGATLVAKAAGKATITCAAMDGSGKKATCTVTVNIPMSRIVVTPGDGYTDYAVVGKSIQLVARYAAQFGTPTNKKIVWSSDSADVKVSQSGRVTVSKTATVDMQHPVTITAAAADGSGVKGSYQIYVANQLKTVQSRVYSNAVVVWQSDLTGEVDNNEHNYYRPIDVKVSGGANAACKVTQGKDGKYYVILAPGKITYPYAEFPALGSSIPDKYQQKMTITVTVKDGSGLKGTITAYVARNQSGEVRIFR